MDEDSLPSQAQMKAMDALFAFSAAMDEGGLSIDDLTAVMRMALQTGHGMLEIQLSMACCAVRAAAEEAAKK